MVTNTGLHCKLQLQAYICRVSPVDQLCNLLYLHSLLHGAVTIDSSLASTANLPFRNDTVNDFNNLMLERTPGKEHIFEAINHVNLPKHDAASEPFAVDYLQSMSLGVTNFDLANLFSHD